MTKCSAKHFIITTLISFTLNHNTKFVHTHLKANKKYFFIKRVSDVAKCQLFDIPYADIEQRYKSKTSVVLLIMIDTNLSLRFSFKCLDRLYPPNPCWPSLPKNRKVTGKNSTLLYLWIKNILDLQSFEKCNSSYEMLGGIEFSQIDYIILFNLH
jgi:hypothetical protein